MNSRNLTSGLIRRRTFLQGGALLAANALTPISFANALTMPDVENASGDVNMLVWEGYEREAVFKDLSKISVKRSFIAQNVDLH